MKRNYRILINLFFFFVLQFNANTQWIDDQDGIYYPNNVGIYGNSSPLYQLNVNGFTHSEVFDWG